MELQHDLEAEELLIVSNRFTRAIERLTGTDRFSTIDTIARAAVKSEAVFTLLISEAERARNQAVRRQDYFPDLYDLRANPLATDAHAFLQEVYNTTRKQTPFTQPVTVPSKQPVVPVVSMGYLSNSRRYRTLG